jgi:hypothetical protein
VDLIRALRIVRHHWLAIALIVVGTASMAVAFATYRNSTIETVSRAEAPISFISDVTELDDPDGTLMQVVQAQLDEARVRAIQVNSELLADPANTVVADPTLGRLTFVARSDDPETAVETAVEMRRRLVTRQPVNMESQIEEQLSALRDQMDEVRAEIVALDAETALPPDVLARRERLTTLLGQLEVQALDLERQVLVPPTGEGAPSPEQLREDLEEVNAAIAEVTLELSELPAPPAEFSEEMTERRALERRFRELEARLQELVLQRSELSGDPSLELVDVFDETPDPIPRRTAAAVALLVGVGLAFAYVLISDRIRRPVWLSEDVAQVPFLGTVPYRDVSHLPWYIQTGDSPRKRAIQTLRSSVRGRTSGRDLVVGISAAHVPVESVLTLGADLALSFASTYASTALIDFSGSTGLQLPETEGHSLSLGRIVSERFNSDQVKEELERAVREDRSAHSSLTAVVAGDDFDVAADVLAGPQVGFLFEALRESMDVVVVMTGDIGNPSTRAALDRTDLVLVVSAPGKTTRAALTRFAEDLAHNQIDLMGVFLRVPTFPRLRRLLSWARDRLRKERPVEEGPSSSLRARVTEWFVQLAGKVRKGRDIPSPAGGEASGAKSRREISVTIESVRASGDGAANSNAAEEVLQSGAEGDPHRMLEYLNRTQPDEAVSSAERFLVDWTTRIIEARPNTGLDPVTVSDIGTAGFVPLSTWKGHPSVGARLRHEFRRALGKREASRLEASLLRSLSATYGSGDGTSMDRWISRNYFELHAAARGWEPTVLHITSPQGTVAALIATERLDAQRIERFVDEVVIRAIERLARRLRRKIGTGAAQASELESEMEDARALGLALAWLMDGSHDDSRLWYPGIAEEDQPRGWQPDWRQGIKLNIAPLQRLGILAVPVLTQEELRTTDGVA